MDLKRCSWASVAALVVSIVCGFFYVRHRSALEARARASASADAARLEDDANKRREWQRRVNERALLEAEQTERAVHEEAAAPAPPRARTNAASASRTVCASPKLAALGEGIACTVTLCEFRVVSKLVFSVPRTSTVQDLRREVDVRRSDAEAGDAVLRLWCRGRALRDESVALAKLSSNDGGSIYALATYALPRVKRASAPAPNPASMAPTLSPSGVASTPYELGHVREPRWPRRGDHAPLIPFLRSPAFRAFVQRQIAVLNRERSAALRAVPARFFSVAIVERSRVGGRTRPRLSFRAYAGDTSVSVAFSVAQRLGVAIEQVRLSLLLNRHAESGALRDSQIFPDHGYDTTLGELGFGARGGELVLQLGSPDMGDFFVPLAFVETGSDSEDSDDIYDDDSGGGSGADDSEGSDDIYDDDGGGSSAAAVAAAPGTTSGGGRGGGAEGALEEAGVSEEERRDAQRAARVARFEAISRAEAHARGDYSRWAK